MAATSDTDTNTFLGIGVREFDVSLPGNRELSHLCHSPPTPTHAALLSVFLDGGDAWPRT